MLRLCLASTALALATACAPATPPPDAEAPAAAPTETEQRALLKLSPLPPLAPSPSNAVADDARAARLGQWLFFDPRLSANGEVACSTCHDPALTFTDGRQLSQGLGTTSRNAPTLLNVAYQRWFFWDGRSDSLWSQALAPLEHPAEMGGDRLAIARLIRDDDQLHDAYHDVFGERVTFSSATLPTHARPALTPPQGLGTVRVPDDDLSRSWAQLTLDDRARIQRVFTNVGKALAAYQRRLVAGDSPFDRFVQKLRDGERDAVAEIGLDAFRGAQLFVGDANCTLCHSGPLLTDFEFHNVLVPGLTPDLARDLGRFGGIAALRESEFRIDSEYSDDPERGAHDATNSSYLVDRSGRAHRELVGQFRTPSLRNVGVTAPYMHHGQLASLRDVLDFYSTHEGALPRRMHHNIETFFVPLELTERQITEIEAFLHTLTDTRIDAAWLRAPSSPRLDD